MASVPVVPKTLLIKKPCPCCRKKFTPRTKHQKYCSHKECQSQRKRVNKCVWQKKPENKKFVQAQQRRWRRRHPGYMKRWRENHPGSVDRNRKQTRLRTGRKRRRTMFEKSTASILQAVGSEADIYTNLHATIIFLCLKRGHILSRAWTDRYACQRIRSGPVRLPRGRLFKVTGPHKTRRIYAG